MTLERIILYHNCMATMNTQNHEVAQFHRDIVSYMKHPALRALLARERRITMSCEGELGTLFVPCSTRNNN
jgi:hypothetical protein